MKNAFKIAYGLARDGKTDKTGTPRKIDHLGVLLALGEMKLPGWQGLFESVLLWIGKRADKKGVTALLRKEYVKNIVCCLADAQPQNINQKTLKIDSCFKT
ncbi:MAG: hypothetical protein IPH68_12985 [Chitinophagaceae bacterium]|nr:hypothetical protein [Chitinophagaceae bacterium]